MTWAESYAAGLEPLELDDDGFVITDPEKAYQASIKRRIREILGPRCKSYPSTVYAAHKQATRNRKWRKQRGAAKAAYLKEYDAYVRACHKARQIPYLDAP